MPKLEFNWKNFYRFSLVFIIEVLIAIFVNDSFIRPFVGDVLVIVLMYFFVKIFFDFPKQKLLIGLLLFSFSVEISQYFHLIELLNLQEYKIARLVLGTTFSRMDFMAYVVGAIIIALPDFLKREKDKKT